MIEYVPMNQTHIQQVAALESACFQDPWSENAIASELSNPLSHWFVAVENGLVAGYVGSQSVMDEADMMNIAVSADCRRKGIAQGLVEQLIQALGSMGVHSLTLEVRASNEPAKALYGKLGFVQTGLRKNYYRNPKEDALILRKEWCN